MPDLLTITLGHTGTMIGIEYWKRIFKEHERKLGNLNEWESRGEEDVNIHFFWKGDEREGKACPRCIAIDLDPRSIETLLREIQIDEEYVKGRRSGIGGTGRRWKKGYNSGEVINDKEDVMGTLEGFSGEVDGIIIIISLGGGIGSGVGSWLIEKIRENEKLKDKYVIAFVVLPAPIESKRESVAVSPYNAVFALNRFSKYADVIVLFDNQALQSAIRRIGNRAGVRIEDLNPAIANVIAIITSLSRFPRGHDLLNVLTNCTPSERCKFVIPSVFPFPGLEDAKGTLPERAMNALNKEHVLVDCDIRSGDIEVMSLIVRKRGDFEIDVIEAATQSIGEEFGPEMIAYELAGAPDGYNSEDIVVLINSYNIAERLNIIYNEAKRLFDRNRYVHWYERDGMRREDIENELNEFKEMVDKINEGGVGE